MNYRDARTHLKIEKNGQKERETNTESGTRSQSIEKKLEIDRDRCRVLSSG